MLQAQGEQFKGGTTIPFRAPGHSSVCSRPSVQRMALITRRQPLHRGVHNIETDKQVREEEEFMPEFTNGLTGLQR